MHVVSRNFRRECWWWPVHNLHRWADLRQVQSEINDVWDARIILPLTFSLLQRRVSRSLCLRLLTAHAIYGRRVKKIYISQPSVSMVLDELESIWTARFYGVSWKQCGTIVFTQVLISLLRYLWKSLRRTFPDGTFREDQAVTFWVKCNIIENTGVL